MPFSPPKKKEQLDEEEDERLCGGCDRLESKCYCVTCECICCGGTDHRYNMRSNMEINEDFYTLDMEEQLRNVMCMPCINNDGDDTDSDADYGDRQCSSDEDDQ